MTSSQKKSVQNADADSGDLDWSSLTFEDAMGKLEEMIERIEAGEIGLEESLTEYEKGLRLFRHCRSILDRAEQRFEKLRLEGGDDDNAGSDKKDANE